MPIQVSDYKWYQTIDTIQVILDLHHTSPKNVDIVTTKSYLKVSFLPYIFEVFFCHIIDTDKTSAKIAKGQIEFNLTKETAEQWDDLGLKLTREELQKKRIEVLEDIHKQEQEKVKERKDERNRRERFSVSQQMSEDDKNIEARNRRIEKEKEDFMKLKEAEESVIDKTEDGADGSKPDLRRRLSSTCSEEGLCTVREADYDGDGEDNLYFSSTENLHSLQTSAIAEKVETPNRKQRKSSSTRNAASKEKEPKKPSLPPVRQSGNIKVEFTPRVFPTPKRESTEAEEEEWLNNQSNYKPKTSTSEENDVDYYRKKASSLFTSGDFRGSVNAYSEALKYSPLEASLYSNRAAANLAVNNLHHAVKDCSKALELLVPPTQENSKSRLLCHIRRGTAFVHLRILSEGLADYQAAQQLNPGDPTLKKDIEKIQGILLTSTDTGDSTEDSDNDSN